MSSNNGHLIASANTYEHHTESLSNYKNDSAKFQVRNRSPLRENDIDFSSLVVNVSS